MKRIAKVAAVSAAGLGLIIGATPAQAAPTGALAFVGSASVTPGLGYPVLGASGVGNAWNFAITTGVGASVDPVAVGPATGNVNEGVLVDGAVVPGAFCGASGGQDGEGTITIDNAVGEDATITFTKTTPAGDPPAPGDNPVGWLQSVASLIVFTDANGAVEGASVIGVVSAVPPLPVVGTGSCSAGTAQDFMIVGAGISL